MNTDRPQFEHFQKNPLPDPFKYKHQTSEEIVYNYMKYSLNNPYADLHPILGNNYVKGIDNNTMLTREQKEGAKDYLELLRVQAVESRKRYNNYVKGIDNNNLLTKEQKEGAKDYLELLRVQAVESRKRYNKRKEEIDYERKRVKESRRAKELTGQTGRS